MSEQKQIERPSLDHITCVSRFTLRAIPSDELGKSMTLGALALALKRYGVVDKNRATLREWAKYGKLNPVSKKIEQLTSIKPGKCYQSTIIDCIEFMQKFTSPQAVPKPRRSSAVSSRQ